MERRKAVDYLEYVTYSGLAILMKKPDNSMTYDFFSVFKPFSTKLWIIFLFSILFSSLILWISLQLENHIRKKTWLCNLELLRKYLEYISGAACTQSGKIPINSSSICRILVGAIWLTLFVLQATYTANLISYIAVAKSSLPANNLKELAEQTSHKIGVIKSASNEILFRSATSGYFKQIWGNIQSDPDNLVSLQQGLSKVRNEKFIFITEHVFLLLPLSSDCDLVMGYETFLPRYLGLITPKNWPYADIVNDRIVRFRESGILNVIFDRHALSYLTCETKPVAIQLELQSLRGVFTVLLVGCVTGFIMLTAENVHAYRMKRQKECQLRNYEFDLKAVEQTSCQNFCDRKIHHKKGSGVQKSKNFQ